MSVENGKAVDQVSFDEMSAADKDMLNKVEQEDENKQQYEPTKEDQDKGSALLLEIENLKSELEKMTDKSLRAQADAQNIKRRAAMDVEKAHKFALDKFVESLLPVVDSLEKGIESVEQNEGSHDAMKEGMELTLKLLLGTLTRFNVKAISPESELFDPNFHQAMSMVPNPDIEPNTIMKVFQKGYILNERVVRPAMVVVSKG